MCVVLYGRICAYGWRLSTLAIVKNTADAIRYETEHHVAHAVKQSGVVVENQEKNGREKQWAHSPQYAKSFFNAVPCGQNDCG